MFARGSWPQVDDLGGSRPWVDVDHGWSVEMLEFTPQEEEIVQISLKSRLVVLVYIVNSSFSSFSSVSFVFLLSERLSSNRYGF